MVANEITFKIGYAYEGRSEIVDRSNKVQSMRAKLDTYNIECCTMASSGSTSEPSINGEIDLRINGEKYFDFFKRFGVFEVTIKGIKEDKK